MNFSPRLIYYYYSRASSVSNWSRMEFLFATKATNANSRLQLTTTQGGVIWFDQVSLMPVDTYKIEEKNSYPGVNTNQKTKACTELQLGFSVVCILMVKRHLDQGGADDSDIHRRETNTFLIVLISSVHEEVNCAIQRLLPSPPRSSVNQTSAWQLFF